MSLFRPSLPLLATCFLGLLALSGCGPSSSSDCATNADCSGGTRCAANGSCVACTDNEHCGDGQFCCQGACYDEGDMEERCGCAPSAGGAESGEACAAGTVCVAGGTRATAASVAEGTCGCTCAASEGGTLCTPDPDGPDGYACTCARTDLATCETPVVDTAGIPHVVADTCTPQNACVCFADGQTCAPDGATPDCTLDGCANLFGDDTNCGVAGRDCTDPGSGDADGRCVAGGCSCDALADCRGTDLNVDSCVIFEGGGQCVCSGYMVNEQLAACPLGLPCTADGCLLDNAGYANAADLYEALGIPAGSIP